MSAGAGAINGVEVIHGAIQESKSSGVSPGLTKTGKFFTVVSQKKKEQPAKDKKAER